MFAQSFLPFYTDDDDDVYMSSPYTSSSPYYHHPFASSPYYQGRTTIHESDELERYRRWKLRKAKEEEILRRQKAYEEQLQRRRQEELERYRRIRQMQQQKLNERSENRNKQQLNDDEDEEPEYAIVRGRDGGFYRVILNKRAANSDKTFPTSAETPSNHNMPNQVKSKSVPIIIKGKTGEKDNSVAFEEKLNQSSHNSTEDSDDEMHDVEDSKVVVSENDNKPVFKKTNNTCNIIVEDASDSESEDDDDYFNSYWCNRRPSPGQWMEPVASNI